MTDTRMANVNWQLATSSDGTTRFDAVHAALLMDLRDELKRLNNLLHCPNFLNMPHDLRAIRRKLERPRIKKRKKIKGGKK